VRTVPAPRRRAWRRRSAWLATTAAVLIAATACHHGSPAKVSSASRAVGSPVPSQAVSAAPAPPPSVPWLIDALENVGRATAKFGLHDDLGCPLATLKVIDYAEGYLGVYHCLLADHYRVRLARSADLLHWAFQTTLDSNASQPTLARLPDRSFVLAVEADNGNGAGPGRRWLRFRHYSDLAALLRARPDRTFNTPHTLVAATRGAEGTPNVYSARLRSAQATSRIEVGFHYLHLGLDRQARGELTDFKAWSAHPDDGLDTALSEAGLVGKHGDRDVLALGSTTVTLLEAQNGRDPFWHLAVVPAAGPAIGLHVRTPGRSRSFANPTMSILRLPTGQPGLVATLYLPRTGAGAKEAGELLYFRPLPGYAGGS